MPSCSSDQNALHGIARCLVRRARAPADRRLVETPTAPPIGIAPGRVHGAFHAARKALTRLVRGNEQAFSISCTRVMELLLARVRHIVRQCVLDRTLRLDRLEPG